jgi:hypothetical protein
MKSGILIAPVTSFGGNRVKASRETFDKLID